MRTGKSLQAWNQGGYRERYAMERGNKSVKFENGRELWVYTYSKWADYQDANGATYDVTNGKWIG